MCCCTKLDKHSTVQQRFFVAAKFRDELDHIVDVILCLYAFVYIVHSCHHVVFAHCLLNDLALFCAVNKPVVDMQSHAVAICEVTEDSKLIGSRRILCHRPARLVEVAADIIVGIELYHARCDHIKVGFSFKSALLFFGHYPFLFHSFTSRLNSFSPSISGISSPVSEEPK